MYLRQVGAPRNRRCDGRRGKPVIDHVLELEGRVLWCQDCSLQPPAPKVTDVAVMGTSWAPAFTAYLDGKSLGFNATGFAIPGNAPQLVPLPWTNVDQITIRFDQPAMRVDKEDLVVRGRNVPQYEIAGFARPSGGQWATWTLRQPVGADRITLQLNAD